MPLKYHTHSERPECILHQWIAYAEHLLKQHHSLHKRHLMRYFARDFFHDGHIYDLRICPQEERVLLVLDSVPAINDACDLMARRYPRKTQEQIAAGINRLYFVHAVEFSRARLIGTKHLEPASPIRLMQFDCSEIRDARPGEYPAGFSVITMRFHFGLAIDIAFRGCSVTPLHPHRLQAYLGRMTGLRSGLLAGRCARDTLRAKIALWRQELAQICKHRRRTDG